MPRNRDPFAPWNDPIARQDPFAPHNDPFRRDDPSEPWNNPLADSRDLDEGDRREYEKGGARCD